MKWYRLKAGNVRFERRADIPEWILSLGLFLRRTFLYTLLFTGQGFQQNKSAIPLWSE